MVVVCREFGDTVSKLETELDDAISEFHGAFKCHMANWDFLTALSNETTAVENYFRRSHPALRETVPWELKRRLVKPFRLHMPIMLRDVGVPQMELLVRSLLKHITWGRMFRLISRFLAHLSLTMDVNEMKFNAARRCRSACRRQLFEARLLFHAAGRCCFRPSSQVLSAIE